MEETVRDNSRLIALFCGTIIAALFVVGIVSHTFLRHVVQSAPLWLAVVLGLKRVRSVRWLALPMLVFWIAIAILVWSFLLGWSRIADGQYSPTEIVMTFVMAGAGLNGVIACLRSRGAGRASTAVGLFLLGAVVQWAAFYLSFLPGIATR